MTSFGIRVKFNDSEMDVLQKALDHHLNVWRREIRKGNGAPGITVFGRFFQDFMRPLQAGQGFSELRSDLDNLHDRRDQERHEHVVAEIATGGHGPREHLSRSNEHDHGTHNAQQDARREAHD